MRRRMRLSGGGSPGEGVSINWPSSALKHVKPFTLPAAAPPSTHLSCISGSIEMHFHPSTKHANAAERGVQPSPMHRQRVLPSILPNRDFDGLIVLRAALIAENASLTSFAVVKIPKEAIVGKQAMEKSLSR
jgi:hypothetical protein